MVGDDLVADEFVLVVVVALSLVAVVGGRLCDSFALVTGCNRDLRKSLYEKWQGAPLRRLCALSHISSSRLDSQNYT